MTTTLDLKSAVLAAKSFLQDLFDARDVVLEEVEDIVDDKGSAFQITFSLPPGKEQLEQFRALGSMGLSSIIGGITRDYKIIRVSRDTCQVESVKIRKT